MKKIQELQTLPEILVVDKPLGISSFDVIRILQKHFGKIKIGHAGTLDPQASGVLVLGVEKGTKKLTELILNNKTYIADVLLGKSTTTGDVEGEAVEIFEYPDLKEKQVEDTVYSMKGGHELPVSLYSAIKKDGKPLYEYARSGEDIDQPIRSMEIQDVAFLDWYKQQPFQIVRVRFSVSKGTYIRSLAEELGKRLGVPASLATLRRTRVGEYALDDSYEIPESWVQEFKNFKKDKKNKA